LCSYAKAILAAVIFIGWEHKFVIAQRVLLNGQVYGLDSNGCNVLVPPLVTDEFVIELLISHLMEINLHSIPKFLIENRALLFVTTKGTSSGNPEDGHPGAKVGSVGQGGPQKAYIAASRANGGPRIHSTIFRIRRLLGSFGSDLWRGASAAGVCCVCCVCFADGFLILRLLFFTATASPYFQKGNF
jgi:hypothetical protein